LVVADPNRQRDFSGGHALRQGTIFVGVYRAAEKLIVLKGTAFRREGRISKEGHGFSRAETVPSNPRLQPLRYGFLQMFSR
jgi:hypothetical protein